MKFSTIIDNRTINMELLTDLSKVKIQSTNSNESIDCASLSESSYSLIVNGKTYYITNIPKFDGYEISVNHYTHYVQVKDEIEGLLDKMGMKTTPTKKTGELYALIPGLVSQIFVKVGDTVKEGEKLCILEAMKMENEIISPIHGIIKSIHIKSGSNVEKGDFILEVQYLKLHKDSKATIKA